MTPCVAVSFQIGLAALGFAWRRKDDKHFFTESLREATKGLDSELEELSRTRMPLSSGCSIPDSASEVEKVRIQSVHVNRALLNCLMSPSCESELTLEFKFGCVLGDAWIHFNSLCCFAYSM